MTRGKSLSSTELALAAETFGRTGSFADAGRAIGRDPDVTRRALQRHGGASRLDVHAAAVDDGLRRAHVSLTSTLALARRAVKAQAVTSTYNGGTVYRAEQIAKLLDSIARATETLGRLAESADRRRTMRTQRARIRAETALLRAKLPTPPDADPVAVVVDVAPAA